MTRIGVVGGYGAVGRAAVRLLGREYSGPLRVGGRSVERAVAVVREDLGGAGEAQAVDVYDPVALADFCRGCDLVVNASGASYQVLDRVAVAAFAAGADYVDAGGDEPLHDRLTAADPAASGRRALVTAGMMPGLTGLLPRLLATTVPQPRELTAYVGVMDRLTPQGAVDYLLSLGDREAESRAAWLGGRLVPRALPPLADVHLPRFPGPVSAFPYLGYEARRLAVDLGLDTVRWYSVFDGGTHMMSTLSRHQGAMSGVGDLSEAARELAAAADLDLFGREPYQLIVQQLTGSDGSVRSVVVRSADTSALTGTVLGLAALQVLERRVPVGAHYAAEALDPPALVDALTTTGVLTGFELLDGPVDIPEPVEEGAL
ncbi:saccharopine dehydrogenase NADP-binding domain-containing protein [Actinokineospora enzanensis]|uniref:saccharopine dehydrogenase NADP-binding domain-containing protein n=1 Tax=Actinokineospora enzanensis TaxID=155975 RepID=UPI000382EDBF|nr:saccharopine dehydrogenase NADP-binding domain-containing protein [Actinokineospora enzanensis]